MSYYVLGTLVLSALVSAKGSYDQNKVAQGIADNNAAIAETQAQDATRRGDEEAAAAMRRARQLAGAQRAGFSARGIDIAEGTAADIIDQTDFFGQVDAATARTNGQKEAWNLRARKRGYEIESNASNPNRAAAFSLLGSAGSVSKQWYAKG
jgi:hypothetical protein